MSDSLNCKLLWQDIVDRYYPAGSILREIYIKHCRSVADKALEINQLKSLHINECDVENAAMLHDIGIFLTDAAGIHCHGSEPYIAHGYLGAMLLREDGVDEKYVNVAQRHTGSGLTEDDVAKFNLPIPKADYLPVTQLERLICYADKFYSKSGDMQEKSLDRVRASMSKFGKDAVARFEKLHQEFG